ncbi:MAG: DEAD/DEAH box helicase family protein [Planctomycetaceae bacterium]
MKTPVVYDTIRVFDREERVLNQEETLAAREKQKQIKDRFRSWVFDDPDRAERLVRIYNDTYNSLRPRLFDGSHLQFPGMNQAIELRPHQQDAVWRTMSSGNTLLAHVVGSGKTFTMAAAGMKLKETGLAHKPMYVVPNHMLEQFSREFLQLYPNAKLLVASKEDVSRDRRKRLVAKVASGEWDGIVVTHSSFERIGMSRDYRERFLREQIADYDALLVDTAAADTDGRHRNIIKSIEKQKAAREEKLTDLLAQDKKDDGLVFDELGVDHLFIDEAQYFKNLELPTKMNRVAGIQTGGSQRAFDLYMKARFLDERHPGHGVTFATGTPISNTMVEMFTLQKFLDPKGLADRGIDHFDAWAATFGEVVDTMEISPDGSTLKARSRFARFTICRNCSRCSGRSPTCRRPKCSICRGPNWKAASLTWSPVRCRTNRRTAAGTRETLRTHSFRKGRSAGRQRSGDHDRRPQAGPRRPGARPASDRSPGIQSQHDGRPDCRHLEQHNRPSRHTDGVLRSGCEAERLGLFRV